MMEERVVNYLTSQYVDATDYTESLKCTPDEEWYLNGFLFYWCEVLGRSL